MFNFIQVHNFSIGRALTLLFVMVALLSGLLIFFVSDYLKHRTINHIAFNEAERTSKLIFQNLNATMKHGWSHDDISSVVKSIQSSIPDIDISLYRNEKVKQLFGVISDMYHPEHESDMVKKTFKNAQANLTVTNNQLHFYYPMIASQECLRCHTNIQQGYVNGVIEILIPVSKLRVPLEFTITSFLYLIIGIFIFLGVIIFFTTRYFLVYPVTQLSISIEELSHDLSKRLPVNDKKFKEIKGLEVNFNYLLDKIELYQQQLREHSEKDPLTGLYNRRKFDELAQIELTRSERYSHSFSLFLIDLNKFKPINDIYGHDAGDEILCKVSQTLLNNLRNEDILARIGGDEFLILLPESNQKYAQEFSRKIKELVSISTIERKAQKLSVSCSIGVAHFPEDGKSLDKLTIIADQNMYHDKKNWVV